VVGTFKNEYGERFVIYRNENGDTPYITGDEYDWKPKVPLLWSGFLFSAEERDQIAKILWPAVSESEFAEIKQALRPDDTPESFMSRRRAEQQQERQQVYGVVYDNPRDTPNTH
jgi:hypothetical protein